MGERGFHLREPLEAPPLMVGGTSNDLELDPKLSQMQSRSYPAADDLAQATPSP